MIIAHVYMNQTGWQDNRQHELIRIEFYEEPLFFYNTCRADSFTREPASQLMLDARPSVPISNDQLLNQTHDTPSRLTTHCRHFKRTSKELLPDGKA